MKFFINRPICKENLFIEKENKPKMSLYKRVYTPNSPLMPLSPMYPIASPSMFLSPYTTSIRSRRSFTPNHLNVLPPPSLSPIQAGILSNKRKLRDPFEPERRLNRTTTVLSSSQKNMKKVRSSVRFIFYLVFFRSFFI